MSSLVLVVASGAAWEPVALAVLADRRDVAVLKRCVDVDDLLAAATAGQANVAVVGLDAPGLDGAAVGHLRAHGVRPVAVVTGDPDGARLHAARIGIGNLVGESELDTLPEVLVRAATELAEQAEAGGTGAGGAGEGDDGRGAIGAGAPDGDPSGVPATTERGRVIAVWGPAGAPGRTTMAAAVAAELARRRRPVVLVDADPFGGAVGQQLGVLDEVSGLLAAARLATGGLLEERLSSVPRRLGEHLGLVTGLPRPDRWSEVRPGALEHLLELLRGQGHVVVDTGFCLEDDLAGDLGGRPGRHHLTLAALDEADAVLAVGGADPVGLSRLARGLAELRERVPHLPLHVVVNRMRPSLGWSERDVAAMVSGFVQPASLHFVPEDRATVDRALVTGRTLLETDADSPVVRAVASVAATLVPDPVEPDPWSGPEPADRRPGLGRLTRIRRRTAGRAHPP